MTSPAQLLEDLVVEQYLGSGDFNGLPSHTARRSLSVSGPELLEVVEESVQSGRLSVLFGDVHPNPHIRAFEDEAAEVQVAKLRSGRFADYVMYPSAALLKTAVSIQDYSGRPYSLQLALGAGQLDYASFDLSVLDFYRRDPRFHFWCNDVTGTISVGNEAYESTTFPEKHKTGIQCFGFSYNDALERAVAVFLTDLAGLTPEHQQLWATHERSDADFKLHPDFYRSQILGEWDLRASLTDAFIEELVTINKMCAAIGWKPIFRSQVKPKEFGFLLRSTRRELNDFVLLLDKLMSDNLNADFYPDRIAHEREVQRKDGTVVMERKGTIALLDEWLGKTFKPADPQPLKEMIAAFREVRKRRQQPAHAMNEDEYDAALFKEQRDLMMRAYEAVRTMRLILTNHPQARPVRDEMNEQVRDGNIWPI